MDFITELKKKPSEEKNRYAVMGAIGVTALISIFWVTSLPSRFAGSTDVSVSATPDKSSGFGAFLDESRTQLGSVFEGVAGEPDPEGVSDVVSQEEETNDFSPKISVTDLVDSDEVATSTFLAPVGSTTVPMVAGTSTATVTPSRPEPRIIMIATTTSQKQE